MAEILLDASDIRVALPDRSRKRLFGTAPLLEILKGVDIRVAPGETIGIVGESGSGKSTLARTLLRFHRPTAGRIVFDGVDITELSEVELRPIRSRLQIVFQDSKAALNPRLTIGAILVEPLLSFRRIDDRRDAGRIAGELLERVGLAAEIADRYPHQLSGGQRQRIGIARAASLRPALVVADEILSGLDVSVQAQMLELLATLQADSGMALVLISHDLSVVRSICDKILVMRAGEIVERGSCDAVFGNPQHPYTRRLLRAIPLPDVDPGWFDAMDLADLADAAAP